MYAAGLLRFKVDLMADDDVEDFEVDLVCQSKYPWLPFINSMLIRMISGCEQAVSIHCLRRCFCACCNSIIVITTKEADNRLRTIGVFKNKK